MKKYLSSMNIYKVSQNVNEDYDTYDSFVVIAEDEDSARATHPAGYEWDGTEKDCYSTWCDAKEAKVELIGATEKAKHEVVLASFNAG
jgi:hypothetical protein